jgi:hypothetical protein
LRDPDRRFFPGFPAPDLPEAERADLLADDLDGGEPPASSRASSLRAFPATAEPWAGTGEVLLAAAGGEGAGVRDPAGRLAAGFTWTLPVPLAAFARAARCSGGRAEAHSAQSATRRATTALPD